VAAGASAPHEGEGHPRYPGTCRGREDARDGKSETASAAAARIFADTGKPACFRLRVVEGALKFHDLFAGGQSFDVAVDAGDFPVTRFAEHRRDADATRPGAMVLPPAYQLACVVDDHAMGIDLVIRGDDLLPSTPRQILLYRALGHEPPRFAHMPLVVGPDGKRLAKRHGESRITQFRQAGISPARVVGWVAWRSGQLETPREMPAAEMVERFDPDLLPRERIILQPDDLAWLAGV
jgi:glutamyl-tRNA synthetase